MFGIKLADNMDIKRLKEEGFVILNEKPKKGADNKLVAFFCRCNHGRIKSRFFGGFRYFSLIFHRK